MLPRYQRESVADLMVLLICGLEGSSLPLPHAYCSEAEELVPTRWLEV